MEPISEQEQSNPRFIKLSKPSDNLKFKKALLSDIFESPEKFFPQLGYIRLIGYKYGEFDLEDQNAIYIKDGEVKKGKSEKMEAELKDLYDLTIDIGATKTSPEMRCKLKLANLLELESDLASDVDEQQPDPKSRFNSIADDWRDKDGKEYCFYVPADPKFLSRLDFSFYTNLSAKHSDSQN